MVVAFWLHLNIRHPFATGFLSPPGSDVPFSEQPPSTLNPNHDLKNRVYGRGRGFGIPETPMTYSPNALFKG